MDAGVDRSAMSDGHEPNATAETENRTGVNRRLFVKTVGAVGGAGSLTALTGTASAESFPSVDSILSNPTVEAVLSEVGNPKVVSSESEQITGDVDGTGSILYLIPTPAGNLSYAIRGSTEVASFFIGNSRIDGTPVLADNFRKRLPNKYKRVPAESKGKVVLADEHSDPEYIRSATPVEKEALSKTLNISVDDIHADIGGEDEEFVVVDSSQDSPTKRYVEIRGGNVVYEGATQSEVETLDELPPRFTTMGCEGPCGICIGGVPACSGCAFMCAGSLVAPPAIIGCALCMIPSCTGGGYYCGKCLDCAT